MDEALGRVAAEQHAVLELSQTVACGLSPSAVRTRVARSRLYRVHHTVFSLVPPELLSRNGRYMAAVLACGPRAALSHRSAGALLDLAHSDAATIDVSVPTPGGRQRRAGIRIHRSLSLRACDIVLVNGVRCTSVARTLFDLAGVLGERRLERALDQAAILELLDDRALQDQMRHNQARRAQASRLGVVLAKHVPGSTPTWNDFEERFLRLSRSTGLPDPEVQQWLDLGDGEQMICADFLWRAQRVIVETDGWQTHRTRNSFESDRRRDQRAINAGWRTVRITWVQLEHEPGRLGSLLLRLVSATTA